MEVAVGDTTVVVGVSLESWLGVCWEEESRIRMQHLVPQAYKARLQVATVKVD